MLKVILFLTTITLLFSCKQESMATDHLNLKEKLAGSWTAKAFDGALHENWHLEKTGWMQQQGYYIEKSDTSYSAKTRIEKVGNSVILFSVIKNGNPKIFKAVKVEDDQLIFENKDYKNPFQVHYKFIDENNYQRTITGYENDSLVSYVFEFQKTMK